MHPAQERTVYQRGSGLHTTARAKNIMTPEAGFINQTDYSMSQPLKQTREIMGLSLSHQKMQPAHCDLLPWIQLSV